MRTRLSWVVLGLFMAFTLNANDKEIIRVRRTYYCATGKGCHEKICGGNLKTAHGRDARYGDGCAVDPRRIPYDTTVCIGGKSYTADDTFGKNQRNRDWKSGIIHVDVRIAGRLHKEVRKMGAGWIEMEMIREKGKIVKLVELK